MAFKTPRQSVNKAYLKSSVGREEMERFKDAFTKMFEKSDKEENEEHLKNILRDFLRDAFYKGKYEINVHGRKDLVIHNGPKKTDSVGVIIEAKAPKNKSEMITHEDLNKKALQELILYYLRERVDEENSKVKHLIITNTYEWFIFDENDFEKLIYRNKQLIKDYQEWVVSKKDTKHFYEVIAARHINTINEELSYTWFDISQYQKTIVNEDQKDDKKLIALFKLLSPTHILKQPFANDSNSLNKHFYNELLHIIGLEEIKVKGKKIIQRKDPERREHASLLENTIIHLQYDTNIAEGRRYEVALELCLTWINRVLFLKLLESQIVSYNGGSEEFEFLNYQKVQEYDTLNRLFFQVLAIKPEERRPKIKEQYAKVPYLNSSLFEVSILETKTFNISNLEDDGELSIYGSSVLKDTKGKRAKGKIDTLEYLFRFLDAYDFNSEGKEQIQEENKNLINASVLGLIFEKINGYKDGSFFTPGFITEYMCRETIRRAVLQKFKERTDFDSDDWDELKSYVGIPYKKEDLNHYNQLINDIKICDPAVGSGHFLVSALNEVLAIKSELHILCDEDVVKLPVIAEVENDELIISLDDADQSEYEYHYQQKDSQRIQKALFFEKQLIIEHCLFGVDINANSVKICQLRLWIELLKHAYYTPESDFTDLETLPNIDINIKCGNSLISRFDLGSDLKPALQKSKYSLDSYKAAVASYKGATNKEAKQAFKKLIEGIKSDFRSEVSSKELKELQKLEGLFYDRFGATLLDVELSKTEAKKKEKEKSVLLKKIEKKKAEIEEVKNNKIYEDAFEWRFEFPEVLNGEGVYEGFDVVIGNPPYMRVQEIQLSQASQKVYYGQKYVNAKAAYDLANIFFELAINISSPNSSCAYIFPHKFLNSAASEVFRKYLKEGEYIDCIDHFGANMIFDDADTYTCIAQFSKKASNGFYFQRFPFKSNLQDLGLNKNNISFISYEMIDRASELYGSNQWILFETETGFKAFEKIYRNSKTFSDVFGGIFVGLQTSKDNLYVLEKVESSPFKCQVPLSGRVYELESYLFRPFLKGKDVQRYTSLTTNKYVFFPYRIEKGVAEIVPLKEIRSKYPKTFKYLTEHEKDFKSRESGKAGKKVEWYAHGRENNLEKFEQPKLTSMEICTNHPNVTLNNENLFHTTKAYSWVKKESTEESYELLLAIANSKVLWWFLNMTGDTLQGDARTFKTNYLNPFPIPRVADPSKTKAIEQKVKRVLTLKKGDPSTDTKKIEFEIDLMIYQLYDLTFNEILVIDPEVGLSEEGYLKFEI